MGHAQLMHITVLFVWENDFVLYKKIFLTILSRSLPHSFIYSYFLLSVSGKYGVLWLKDWSWIKDKLFPVCHLEYGTRSDLTVQMIRSCAWFNLSHIELMLWSWEVFYEHDWDNIYNCSLIVFTQEIRNLLAWRYLSHDMHVLYFDNEVPLITYLISFVLILTPVHSISQR